MRPSIEHADRAERGVVALLVEPGEERLEACVHRQRARLVDHLGPRLEPEDRNRPPAAMRIARVRADLGQPPRVATREQ